MYPLRVYLAEERIFLNCEYKINIGLLKNECDLIKKNLQPYISKDVINGEQVSGIVVLPEKKLHKEI